MAAKEALGQGDFLKLLITQLQNQDPLKPMEDKDFITQLAQFNSLDQMEQMSASLKTVALGYGVLQAEGMLGKSVSAVDATKGTVTGTVTGVVVEGGAAFVEVDGAKLPVSAVNKIA